MRNKYIDKLSEFYKAKIKPTVDSLFAKTAVIRTGKKKIVYHPIKVLVVVLCVALCISIVGSFISSFLKPKNIDVSFEFGNSYRTKVIDKDVLIYNNKNVKAISAKGKTLWQINETLSEPVVEVGGKNMLLMDLAGNHFATSYKNGKVLNEYQLGNDIISGKITKKGYAVFATDTDGYKGKVSLYNKRGREIYVWNSGSGYITDVDITDNGRFLAVAQLLTESGTVNTKIQIIDTGRGETVGTIEKENEVATEVSYNPSGKLIVVTDNSISGYSKKGKEKFTVSLAGKDAKYYNIDSEEMIAVNVMDNRGNSVLELYNMSGKHKGTYVATGDIHAISVCGKKAVVVEQRGVVRVSMRGKERKVVDMDGDVSDLGYFSNGKNVLTIGASNAEIIAVK